MYSDVFFTSQLTIKIDINEMNEKSHSVFHIFLFPQKALIVV